MQNIIALLASGAGFVAETYPGIWMFDTSRYLLGAGSVFLIVNILLAPALRNRKIRHKSPGWPQMRREILASLRSAAIFAGIGGLTIAVLAAAGFDVFYGDPLARGWGYLIFSTLMLIVLHDAWFYWTALSESNSEELSPVSFLLPAHLEDGRRTGNAVRRES